MNSKKKRLHFCLALLLALGVFGISTTAVLADQPTKTEFTFNATGVLADVCSFPVDVDANVQATEIDYDDSSGGLTRVYDHFVEQDVFTANGKKLVGIPFTFNIEILFDNNGNVTHVYADGITEKIPLPDGSLFISAGRLDFTTHPGATMILSPDKGNQGNVAGFCAALSS